jgi:hypothetical protein
LILFKILKNSKILNYKRQEWLTQI